MAKNPDRIRVGGGVTISPRGKKRIWTADYCLDGKHCRTSLETGNKKVALQRAAKLVTQLSEGTLEKLPPAVAFQPAIDAYLQYLETERRARKTLVKYRGVLTAFAKFLQENGVLQLAQFRVNHFDRYRAERNKTRHRKTLYTEGVIVKQFVKWAKSRKLLAENPIVDVKLTKPLLVPKEGPSLEQVDSILATLDETQRPAIAVLAFTGMRAGELQRLQPRDIDLQRCWIHICSRQGLETKTGLSRKVPIHARLRPILMAMSRQARTWFFTSGAANKSAAGTRPINIKKLNEQFQTTLAALGMPFGLKNNGFTLHSLRHFFETFTVNSDIPQRVVDNWLGHSSDRSMAAVYYKLRDEDSQRFMVKVPFGTGQLLADASEEVQS